MCSHNNLTMGQFPYLCQIIFPVPFQTHVPACSTYWEADLCTTSFHLAAGMSQERKWDCTISSLYSFLAEIILRWMHPRIHSLFIHLPVTFVLAFSGLGVLMMQDILIPVYYTITNDSFHLNFIITNDSFLNFFPKFPVWECQVFLSRYLTIHNAVCISQNRFGFYSNNWRKVLCLCLCLCFYYIQAREKKIWQIT